MSKENKEVHATEPVECENPSAVLALECVSVSEDTHDIGIVSTPLCTETDSEAVSEYQSNVSEDSFQQECDSRISSTPARLPLTASGNCVTVVS